MSEPNGSVNKAIVWRGHPIFNRLLRFLSAGLINTALTFCLFQALLLLASPSIAYTSAWLVGVVIVVIAYPDKVFGEGNTSWQVRLVYGCLYVVTFFMGLLLLGYLLDDGWNPRIAATAVVAWNAAAGYVSGSLLFVPRPSA
jgi:putative flippase GtrA